MPVLEVRHLKKSYGTVSAVEDISFSVEPGEVFTIIGPNGAGKTTTLEMIEGLQAPDAGQIQFGPLSWAKNSEQIKVTIGVQPQSRQRKWRFNSLQSSGRTVKALRSSYGQRSLKKRSMSCSDLQRTAVSGLSRFRFAK